METHICKTHHDLEQMWTAEGTCTQIICNNCDEVFIPRSSTLDVSVTRYGAEQLRKVFNGNDK